MTETNIVFSNTKKLSSRTRHLLRTLNTLEMDSAKKALYFMIEEMSKEKGFHRKDGTHYYYHLVDVAQLLLNHGIKKEAYITAALLHDSVEDLNWYTEEMLEEDFGSEVREIVMLVTKDKTINYHTEHEAMLDYLSKIIDNEGAALVKTADRIHNFSTLKHTSIEHREKQLINTETYFIPFFKECRNIYIDYESFFFQAKTSIEPIAAEIKRYIEDVKTRDAEIERLNNIVKSLREQG